MTEEEIKIFAHNQKMFKKMYEEQRYKKYLETNEKQKLYQRERRRLRKSALSNF